MNSGSAFPHDELTVKRQGQAPYTIPASPGMTKSELYAMHAPTEIPEWFQIAEVTPKPQLPDACTLSTVDRSQFDRLRLGQMSETVATFEALAFYREFTKVLPELTAWTLKNEAARYFAWRWHFAGQMLASGATVNPAQMTRPKP